MLGAILVHGVSPDEVTPFVDPGDFYTDTNSILFKAVLADDTTIDAAALVRRLKDRGELEEIGGEAYLAELMHNAPATTQTAIAHAKRIRETADQRRLRDAALDALYRIRSGESVDDIRAAIEPVFFDDERNVSSGPVTCKDAVFEFFKELDKPETPQIKTGFSGLDDMIGGFTPGQMVIIAARPGQGKTAFATNVVTNMVAGGVPVLFFSLEMSNLEITQRLFSSIGQIPLRDIRSRPISQQTRQRVAEYGEYIAGLPLLIDDASRRRVLDLESVSRRAIRKHGVGCVVIDYLGLIEPDMANQTRYEQVTAISRQIKTMARRLSVPVIVLAQLNREASSSKDRRPKISHLRDSGAIEQDADIVILIHRESKYDDQADKSKAEIIVAKNRNGTTGGMELRWEGWFTRFVEEAGGEEADGEEWQPDYCDGKQAAGGDYAEF